MRRSAKARLYVGSADEHEVYEGECYAVELGMNLIAKERPAQAISIAVDNQAAIKALADPKPGPGRHLSDRIHKAYEKLKRKHPQATVIVKWVPGHTGISGNEKVDREAKRAVKGPQENRGISKSDMPPRWIGKNTCKRERRETCEEETAVRRGTMQGKERIYELTNVKKAKRHFKVVDQLPRQNRAMLTQLRTGHVPLNVYLHRFKRKDSPRCEMCKGGDETVEHYLLWCQAYETQRKRAKRSMGVQRLSKNSILATERGWEVLFRFINETRRFADVPRMRNIKVAKDGEVKIL